MTKGRSCLFFLIFFLVLLLWGCKESGKFYPYACLTHSYYDSLRAKRYVISEVRIRWYIDSLRLGERDSSYTDLYVDRYYADGKPFIWITMNGVMGKLDTLLKYLDSSADDGISPKAFYTDILSQAVKKLREFDFTDTHNINLMLAEAEYYSTKGYFRYATGMSFGFINPYILFNHLDKVDPEDSVSKYRILYDVATRTPHRSYYDSLLTDASDRQKLHQRLAALYPESQNYLALKKALRLSHSASERRKIAVNMERYRWRTMRQSSKYVWINLPEFMLRACDEASGEQIEMRVCEGSVEHKTPLLSSNIERVELNPVWIVPQSIVSREIAPYHAGDAEWFERKKMKIIDRESGDEVSPASVDPQMLRSGDYTVIQSRGEGNALGKMIFRFPNKFSIFLHDTPNRDVFSESFRALSHGCIRLEKPLDLALFLLQDKAPEQEEKIRAAIDNRTGTGNADRKSLGFLRYDPPVPVYITYFTAYPSPSGKITFTADPYRYDDLIYSGLSNLKRRRVHAKEQRK